MISFKFWSVGILERWAGNDLRGGIDFFAS
jgi:hypothetical protein